MPAPLPSRRCNHSCCVYGDSLLIYGGHDILEGIFSDLWTLELTPESTSDHWTMLNYSGDSPGQLCRHSAVINNECMLIIGGTNGETQSTSIYSLSIQSLVFSKLSISLPGFDSHSSILYNETLIIFGGYQGDTIANTLYAIKLNELTCQKSVLINSPRARISHTAVLYGNSMYVYGGKCSHSEALNDMWELNLIEWTWQQIEAVGDSPGEVSGHSACVYRDVMLVFGGIKDEIKETNEMFAFDFINISWALIQTETEISDPVILQERERKKKVEEIKAEKKKVKKGQPEELVRFYYGPPAQSLGRIKGKVPYSRDSHTASIYKNFMVIFGGDRLQMAFNDTYFYSINEQNLKKY